MTNEVDHDQIVTDEMNGNEVARDDETENDSFYGKFNFELIKNLIFLESFKHIFY